MSLKKLRMSRHLSQEQLALISGLNVRTIQRIERGHTASMESLKCLASALEIDTAILKQEITMADNTNMNLMNMVRKQKVEIHTLLAVGVIFMLFGASAVGAKPLLGAIFYASTAFCFLVAAAKMFKHNIYTWR